jgi:hypothetical protein
MSTIATRPPPWAGLQRAGRRRVLTPPSSPSLRPWARDQQQRARRAAAGAREPSFGSRRHRGTRAPSRIARRMRPLSSGSDEEHRQRSRHALELGDRLPGLTPRSTSRASGGGARARPASDSPTGSFTCPSARAQRVGELRLLATTKLSVISDSRFPHQRTRISQRRLSRRPRRQAPCHCPQRSARP